MRKGGYARYIARKIKRNKVDLFEVWMVVPVVFLVISCVLMVFVSHVFKIYADELPTTEKIKGQVSDREENSFVYDRNGKLLYIFSDPNRDREYAEYREIPPNIIWAVLAAEDESFFEHEGIDFLAISRALGILIRSQGNDKVGGSTITQQLVKNTVFNSEKTMERKIKEMIVALILEKEYEKEYILELYLNTASFGGRVTGIKAAARTYFQKDLSELSLAESVFLVSLIQRPGDYSPLFGQDQDRAWQLVEFRMKYVFDQLEQNYDRFAALDIDKLLRKDIIQAKKQKVSLNPDVGNIKAPHFVFYVKSLLGKEPYNISEEMLYNGGYRIHATLDLSLQALAEAKLDEGLNQKAKYRMSNGALVSLDPKTGDLLAMVGSKDFFGERDLEGRFDPQVNVALSERNLGSSLKPFLVYTALESGKYSPSSYVYDKKINIDGYAPKNWDGKFMGKMTIEQALIQSRNTPFVQILDRVGVQEFLDELEKVGYNNATHRDRYGLAIALGGFDANLLEHTHAYSTLANLGQQAKLRPILRIENYKGEIIFENEVEVNELLVPDNVVQVNEILKNYDKKYGTSGKTGTTDSNKDNYYIGYSDKLVTGIWIGNNNNAQMASMAFGSTTAKPIWQEFYAAVIEKLPEYVSQL